MLVNLRLSYSKDIYIDLLKEVELQEVDNITLRYLNKTALLTSDQFIGKVNEFYFRYSKYRESIKKAEDKIGNLEIICYDRENKFNNLSVLYQSDQDITNTLYIINKIEEELKKCEDKNLILKIYKECDFFLGTEYNYVYNKIGQSKNLILNYGIVPNTKKHYLKLIKILKEELSKKYDENQEVNYYRIRIVYDLMKKQKRYINNLLISDNISSQKKYHVSNKNNNSKKISKKARKDEYHGMGDYFLDYYNDGEKVWRK